MRILVVEDDEVIGSTLQNTLTKEGYRVDWEQNGKAGLQAAQTHPYSVVVLDVMMPVMDGWEVCAALRRAKSTVPVLMLTARDSVDDKVKGLDVGADDYRAKPFDFRELTARVRALARRSKVDKSAKLTVDDLEIDPADRSVRRAGALVHLTPREYELLEALARNRGRVLTREVIITNVWGDDESFSNTVNFHVTALRKKIDADRENPLIQTVHGFGYRLREPLDP
jgi:DNA-binding response OmpR family regulator